jgi:hypothetical protein
MANRAGLQAGGWSKTGLKTERFVVWTLSPGLSMALSSSMDSGHRRLPEEVEVLSSHFMPNVSLVRAVRMVKTTTRAGRLADAASAQHRAVTAPAGWPKGSIALQDFGQRSRVPLR